MTTTDERAREILKQFAIDAYWHGEEYGDYDMEYFSAEIDTALEKLAVLAQEKERG